MTAKYDVDQLTNALQEFLIATGQEKDLKQLVKTMRVEGNTETVIARHVIGSAYDRVAYGN
jgi:hypothetical protein